MNLASRLRDGAESIKRGIPKSLGESGTVLFGSIREIFLECADQLEQNEAYIKRLNKKIQEMELDRRM